MKILLSCFFLLVIIFEISQSLNSDPYSDQFSTCCKEKGVSASCQQHCNFDFHPDEVIRAFANGTCHPETDTAPYYQCLQNSKNMSKCCIEFGVIASEKPRYCLDLCDGSTPIIYDKKYALCEPVQSSIMSCGIDSYYDNFQMLHKSNEVFKTLCRSSEFPPTNDPSFTIYQIGYAFTVYGTVSCAKPGRSVGNTGIAILMEHDPLTVDDEFGRADIIDNTFKITYDPNFFEQILDGDFPTPEYEFYLVFKSVCRTWRDSKSGVILSHLNVSYVVTNKLWPAWTHVPEPFPGIAKSMSELKFRTCWINAAQSQGCDFKDFINAKNIAQKFELGPA